VEYLDQSRARSPFYQETHLAWAASVRKFVQQELVPNVDAWEAAGELPRALHKKAAAAGLIGMGFPAELGGFTDGIDAFHSVVTSQELALLGAGGVPASLLTHGIGLPPVVRFGSDAMKQRIAPAVLAGDKIIALAITEPGGGSDVANLKTRAERRGDTYIVNGSKMFITSGMRADYYTVAVRTGGPGAGGISLLLLEKGMKGFSQTKLDKMGWHSSDTAALYFDDVEVPAENLIGAENAGFYAVMVNFNSERIGMAAQAIGYSWACFDDALAWARQRETFGKKLLQHQVIRQKLSSMYQQIATSQAWLELSAHAVNQNKANPGELALLKVQATKTMEYCAREAAQILGGASYMRGCRIERIYREVRVQAIGGGSEEIMLDLAAKQLGF
jgi:acyl-CoA dehydrogenase